MSAYEPWPVSGSNRPRRSSHSYNSSTYDAYPPSNLMRMSRTSTPCHAAGRPPIYSERQRSYSVSYGCDSERHDGHRQSDPIVAAENMIVVNYDSPSGSRQSSRRASISASRLSYRSSHYSPNSYRAVSESFPPLTRAPRRTITNYESGRSVPSRYSQTNRDRATYPSRRDDANNYSSPQRLRSPPPPPAVEGMRMSRPQLRRVTHLDLPATRDHGMAPRTSSHRSSPAAYSDSAAPLSRDLERLSLRSKGRAGAYTPSSLSSGQQYDRPVYDSGSESMADPYQRGPPPSVYLRPTPHHPDEVYPDDSISNIVERGGRRDSHGSGTHGSSRLAYERSPEYRSSNRPRGYQTPVSQRPPGSFESSDYRVPYSGYS